MLADQTDPTRGGRVGCGWLLLVDQHGGRAGSRNHLPLRVRGKEAQALLLGAEMLSGNTVPKVSTFHGRAGA